ncbi:hypothetical protein ACFWY6_12735 [Streptomyces sp. NPDC059037]|uniref:hypothetical protein n=1 Tax=Streptomyces sp. NPDC059037 TaxID=3346710 RepID=UPI0036B2005B
MDLARAADEALWALPDDVHGELLALIDSVADAPDAQPTGAVVAFGASSWVTCSVSGDVVTVLDVGWTG